MEKLVGFGLFVAVLTMWGALVVSAHNKTAQALVEYERNLQSIVMAGN